jgi:hypothetical protein
MSEVLEARRISLLGSNINLNRQTEAVAIIKRLHSLCDMGSMNDVFWDVTTSYS